MSFIDEECFAGMEDMFLNNLYEDIEYINIPAWRMRNGKLIALKDMKTSHIVNCVKMIQRNPGWRDNYLSPFDEELRSRGILPEPPSVVYINL